MALSDPVTIYQVIGTFAFLTLFFMEYAFFTWMIEHWSKRTESAVSGTVIGIYLVWFATVAQTLISFGLLNITIIGISLP
jgi:hypothetical protein